MSGPDSLLKRTAQIDTTNTTTLRYLQEIEEATGKSTNLSRQHIKSTSGSQEERGISGTLRYMSGTEMIIQPTTFRDSSTIATFINIILGLLLGGAIVWFLVVPANRQAVNDQANQQVTDANTKLASESARVQELEEEIDGYLQQVESKPTRSRRTPTAKVQSYEDLLAIANLYVSGDQSTAASMITSLNADDFEGNAKTLYDSLSGAVQSSLFTEYYNAGTQAYAGGDYTTAAAQLQLAVDADPNRENANYAQALFYLGFAYYNLGNYDQSDSQRSISLSTYYPDRAAEVQPYIVGGYLRHAAECDRSGGRQRTGRRRYGPERPGNRTDPGAGQSESTRRIPGTDTSGRKLRLQVTETTLRSTRSGRCRCKAPEQGVRGREHRALSAFLCRILIRLQSVLSGVRHKTQIFGRERRQDF